MKKIFLFCIFFASVVYSQDIKFTGYGAAGYRFIDRIRVIESNQETYYEGKFQAEFEINKHIEAQLDFRGNSDEQRIDLREFSAKFKYIPRLNFEIGNIKKPFTSEYTESEEDLPLVRRSFITESAGLIGYTGRSVGIMAYYNSKDSSFPHSYAMYIFKNNNLQNGFVGRYIHHFNDLGVGVNYFLLNTGGDYRVTTNGFAANILYDIKDFTAEAEAMLLEDPVEEIRRVVQKKEMKIYAYGIRVMSAKGFDTGGEVIKEIEPVVLLSYYQPDTRLSKQHTIETAIGVNFYFHKNVRLRLNGDALFSRNEFSSKYSTHDSRFTIEVQVRY